MILPAVHGTLFRLLIRRQHFQSVPLTYLIRFPSQLFQTFFIDLDFQSRFGIDGVDDEVIVPVIPINVSSYHHFKAFKGFCHLQPDLMNLLGSCSAIGREGLYILFEENAACFVEPPLGCHKLMIGAFCYAVLSADQLLTIAVIIFVNGFLILHYIVDNALHSCCGLCFLGYCGEYCHQPHLLRISESCSMTPE